MTQGKLIIESLSNAHEKASFDSGVSALDEYLKTRAGQDMRRSVAAAYILRLPENNQVIGYYTLSAAEVWLQSLPSDMEKKLPRYSKLPATLIGRLATDLSNRGCGFGKRLLMDALARSYRQKSQIGACCVVVDAKDDQAAAFYRRFGFRSLNDAGSRLFVTMQEVKRLIGSA